MRPLILFVFLFVSTVINAQYDDGDLRLGIRQGFTNYLIDGVETTLIKSELYAPNSYTVTPNRRWGGVTSLYLYYKPDDLPFVFEPMIEWEYSFPYDWDAEFLKSDFNYTDIEGLEYDIWFNNHYINVIPYGKFYLYRGLSIGFGLKGSFPLTKREIIYRSNEPDLDLQVQSNLRNVLAFKAYITPIIGIGYDFEPSFNINVQWIPKTTNVLDTFANGYNFIENYNGRGSFQLTFGWLFEYAGAY